MSFLFADTCSISVNCVLHVYLRWTCICAFVRLCVLLSQTKYIPQMVENQKAGGPNDDLLLCVMQRHSVVPL